MDWVASASALVGSFAAIAAVLVAAISAVIGLRTYRDQLRSRQTQWLLDLRQRLVEGEVFRLARFEIEKGYIRLKSTGGPPGANDETSAEYSDDELRASLAINHYLNMFEILERLIEAARLDERDVYFAFVADLEAALRFEPVASEVNRYYPGIRRLDGRFKRIHTELYG